MERRLGCVVLLVVGCVSPSAVGTSDTDAVDGSGPGTTTADSSSTGSTSASASSTSASATSGSTTDEPSSSSSGPEEECVDVPPLENPEMYNCSTEDDQCPPCYKCTYAWDGGDGFPPTTGTVCVPVVADPQGPFEPCSYGDQPGFDDCDAESICWSPDPDSTAGYCIPRCTANLECREGTSCVFGGDGALGCIPTCDPLRPSCADPSEGCLQDSDAFICWPGEWGGLGDSCLSGGCAEGLACLWHDYVGPDCAHDACCVPACDLAVGGCTGPGESCLTSCFTGIEQPPHIGACGIEPETLPLSCEPSGVEPNIPWCSGAADECPNNLAGGSDDCIDECMCNTECDDVAECPVPETGNATMLCEPANRMGLVGGCVLTCADGETCPDGMACSTSSYPGYCMWYRELEPGCAG